MRPHRFGANVHYIVSDPLTNEHTRLSPEAWKFLSRLTPGCTVGDAWEMEYRSGNPRTLTQNAVTGLIVGLYERNLLTVTSANDSERLALRGEKAKSKPLLTKIQTALFFPLPLFDPDRALRRAGPIIRLIFGWPGMMLWAFVVLSGISTLIERWGEITAASLAVFSKPDPYVLFVAFLISKFLHELGHAGMCRRFGGAVHTMGLMFLLFAPLPYVDVSSSWGFKSRSKRIAVGAGGMLVDVLVGAVATIVWAHTPSGPLNDAAISLMLTATAYTVLFNANPLMRFDGYYIVCDLWNQPNLSARANNALKKIFFTGIGIRRRSAEQENYFEIYLSLFGLASFIYRSTAVIGIIIFLSDKYFGIGLLVALFLAFGTLIEPVKEIFKHFFRPLPQDTSTRARRLSLLTIGMFGGAFIFIAPLPAWVDVPVGIEAHGARQLTASTAGWLPDTGLMGGGLYNAGDEVMRLEDYSLTLDIAELAAQIERNDALERRALADGGVDLAPIKERRRALSALMDRAKSDVEGLAVRSPIGGYWVTQTIKARAYGWVERGVELGLIVPPNDFHVVAIVSQANSGKLARSLPEGATLRCPGTAGERLEIDNMKLVPQAIDRLPNPALGSAGGGPIAVSGYDSSGTASVEPVFRLDGRIATVIAPCVKLGTLVPKEKPHAEGLAAAMADELQLLSDEDLRSALRPLRLRIRKQSNIDFGTLVRVAPILTEITSRATGMRPYKTGEGKSLTAAMAAVLAAWTGKPCHVLTANCYLADRDAAFFKALFNSCELSVDVVTEGLAQSERQRAYSADVVYTTAKEMLGDLLRDEILIGPRPGPKAHYFSLELDPSRDINILAPNQLVELSPFGIERLSRYRSAFPAPWSQPEQARGLVELTLTARFIMQYEPIAKWQGDLDGKAILAQYAHS
eukprot:gene1375-1394_t